MRCSKPPTVLHIFPVSLSLLTGADAGGPGGQAAGCCAAVEGADVLRGQKLRKHSPLQALGLTAQQGRTLGRHVHDLPRQERHSHGECVLGKTMETGLDFSRKLSITF